jgi:hypothetical protein
MSYAIPVFQPYPFQYSEKWERSEDIPRSASFGISEDIKLEERRGKFYIIIITQSRTWKVRLVRSETSELPNFGNAAI